VGQSTTAVDEDAQCLRFFDASFIPVDMPPEHGPRLRSFATDLTGRISPANLYFMKTAMPDLELAFRFSNLSCCGMCRTSSA
jgi:hypothetical protein